MSAVTVWPTAVLVSISTPLEHGWNRNQSLIPCDRLPTVLQPPFPAANPNKLVSPKHESLDTLPYALKVPVGIADGGHPYRRRKAPTDHVTAISSPSFLNRREKELNHYQAAKEMRNHKATRNLCAGSLHTASGQPHRCVGARASPRRHRRVGPHGPPAPPLPQNLQLVPPAAPPGP